jgi:exosortase/archaeosortase family protein
MLVFNLFVYRGLAAGGWWDAYLAINAQASAAVLSMLGYPVGAAGASLTSPQFPMSIATGCDAVQASAFFVFAMLLSPVAVSRHKRLLPVIGGLVFLAVINVLRIVSLYLVGVYYVQAFDFVHGELWQLLFILLPLVLWLLWLRTAMRGAEVGEHVAG